MTFEQLIPILTVVTTISVKLIGIPSQIRKIHLTKSVESISILHFSLGFMAYVLWIIHGVLKMDWTINYWTINRHYYLGALLSVIFKINKNLYKYLFMEKIS